MINKRKRIADEEGLARCIAYVIRLKRGEIGERLACPPWLEEIPFVLPDARDYVAVGVWSRRVAKWLVAQATKHRNGKAKSKWLAVHLSASLHPDEPWEPEVLQRWTKQMVAEVMAGKRSAIYATHLDRHTHAIVMVVDDKGTVWNPRLDYRLWEMAAEKCEVTNKLHRVQTRKGAGRYAEKTGTKSEELNMVLRTQEASEKMKMQDALDKAIAEAKTVHEFFEKLREAGIEVQLNRAKTTGHISGISYRKCGFTAKGSALGKKYAWLALSKRFAVSDFQEPDWMAKRQEVERIEIVCKAKGIPQKKQYKKTLELAFRPLEHGIYAWQKSGRIAFIDEGNRISLESENRTALRAALQLARAKGWTEILVTGSAGFQQAVQSMAEKMGIKTYGRYINEKRTTGGNPIPLVNLPAIPTVER